MRGYIEGLLQVRVVNLVPQALLLAHDDSLLYPVRAAIIQAVGALRKGGGNQAGIANGDGNLTQLTAGRYLKNGHLVVRLNRLDPAGIGVAGLDLVPGGVIGVALVAFDLAFNGDDLVAAEEAKFFGVEGG